jgi:hypothetical protein
MRTRGCTVVLLVGLLGLSARAGAEDPPEDASRLELLTPHGLGLTLGAGATGFLGQEARTLAGGDRVGFYADLRLAYGTRSRFAGEVAFTRAGRPPPLEDRRRGVNAIYGHGFECLLRVNHPMHRGPLFYSPFAVAGLGWTDYRPGDDREPTTRARRLDRVGMVPLGLGLAASYRVLYGEARLMYRPTFREDALGTSAGHGPSMQAWFAGVAAGVEF